MYPAIHAIETPDKPAFIMASSGQIVTYAELDRRSNRLAHYLRDQGLGRLAHYSIFMENNDRFIETCAAGTRAGHYFTCINSFLKADEVAYILDNSESEILITSTSRLETAMAALADCPRIKAVLLVDGPGDGGMVTNLDDAVGGFPDTPIADERIGTPMLYSSGTTGRPKGVLRPLPDEPATEELPLMKFLSGLWLYRKDMVYLSPAPMYHSAPQAAVALAIRAGATVIVMEKFDPEQYLSLIEKYRVTHSQLVPTMFSRMLKLPEEVRTRYDLSSLETAIHAAAPCPVQVKHDMIKWWGPVIHEYYGATEGLGFSACNSEEWLAHPGTVGKVLFGELKVLDEDMNPSPPGQPGTLWFKSGSDFEYFNDPDRTLADRSPDGTMSTVGDVGYIDEDGFMYLTDRATFMIISGGANIYPQECEDLLITHPKVADAAVFGVPNEDLGEEVKAAIQLMPGQQPGPETEAELIAFCRENLASIKCPRSIDFEAELPRLPTGKLYKRLLRDRYWKDHKSKIA